MFRVEGSQDAQVPLLCLNSVYKGLKHVAWDPIHLHFSRNYPQLVGATHRTVGKESHR